MKPYMYKILVMTVAKINIDKICDCLKGDIEQVNDMHLSNADEIEKDLRAALKKIDVSRVIQTPRLSIVNNTR